MFPKLTPEAAVNLQLALNASIWQLINVADLGVAARLSKARRG